MEKVGNNEDKNARLNYFLVTHNLIDFVSSDQYMFMTRNKFTML